MDDSVMFYSTHYNLYRFWFYVQFGNMNTERNIIELKITSKFTDS